MKNDPALKARAHREGLFLSLVLDKAKAHLALARRKVQGVEGVLVVCNRRPAARSAALMGLLRTARRTAPATAGSRSRRAAPG